MAVSLVSNYFSFNNRIDLTCDTPEPPLKFYDNFDNNESDHFKQDIEQMEFNFYNHQQQNQQQSFEEIRGTFNIENEENFSSAQNQNFTDYQNNYVDSPPDSKEAWPVDYHKTTIMNSGSNANNGQECLAGNSRKRRIEWTPHSSNDVESSSKIVHIEKEKDHRRKTQGRFWPEDIDIDLSNELPVTNSYLSDSLLNFPVFKQEMTSPKIHEISKNDIKASPVNNDGNANHVDKNCGFRQDQGEQGGNGMTNLQNFLQQNGYDGSGSSNQPNDVMPKCESMSDDNRFQYVLAAATSIATKNNEESLTYLNQGQSYEIKLKKLGDLSPFRGKLLKSVIKICFQERRLQYMEREQMQLWQASRPGERILDVDIPLSYGLIQVNQSPTTNANLLNTVEVFWDPMKEVGIYIKVNCISTEFTPKKHGGEKGVPFRIQVETYIDYTYLENCKDLDLSTKLLHAAGCQIKVFKLKGADRKHKQDREKIQKRPVSEQEKYQRSCDCTILNDIPCETIMSPVVGGFSPEHIKRNISPILTSSNSPVHASKYDQIMFSTYRNNGPVTPLANNPIVTSTNGIGKTMDQNVLSPTQAIDNDDYVPMLTKDSSPNALAQWLNFHRLNAYANTFAHFSGSDLLRMSKEDLMKICGLADGIRMFNILHSKAITPRLTIFVSFEANIFHAIYLHTNTVQELIYKLQKTPGFSEHNQQFDASPSPSSPTSSSFIEVGKLNVFLNGPNNIHVLLTDEVLNNLQDEGLFHVDFQANGILMKALHSKNISNIGGKSNEK